ncbi:MAG: HlyD family efflux transporter periplasmic adaptor subunit, partial [Planctomycetota bacterium]
MASPIRILGTAVRWLAPVLVVVAGAAVARTLFLGREAPPRSERPPRVMPVDVLTVRVDDHESTIRAYGTVRPRRTLSLRPTVGGPIDTMHPALIQGGRIDAGEVVASIDDRDYVLAVKTADAALVAAKTDLDIELGNAYVAEREWELLDADLEVTEEGRRLALREPYVERRRADLDSARANLERAKLDLERTKLVAPFDALVLSEDVEIGTQVSAGTQVAQLVDRTEFLVEVSVPSNRL